MPSEEKCEWDEQMKNSKGQKLKDCAGYSRTQ